MVDRLIGGDVCESRDDDAVSRCKGGRKPLAASVCCALFCLFVSGSALAHAALVKSVPGSRAQLGRLPSQIELCFNEAVELKFSSVRLTAPNGDELPLGELSSRERDPKCLLAPVPELKVYGTYTVNYRVLSKDGHVVEYGYTFTLQADFK